METPASIDDRDDLHRIAVQNAQEAILVAQDGLIMFVNPKAAELLGRTKEELTGTAFVQFIHVDDRELVIARHRARLGGESPPEIYEFRVVRGTGAVRWVAIKVVVTTWRDRPATFSFLTDITDARAIAERQQQKEEQLQQAQQLESLGLLAGGVAHDINNILATITGLASILEAELESTSAWRPDIDSILAACHRGRELTTNLLGFARKGKKTKRRVSLNDVASDVAALLDRTLSKKIEIHSALEAEPDAVEGDPSQLHHAVMNICINAADAMAGEGIIRLTTQNVVLGRAAVAGDPDLEPGRFVRLTVVDTGCGMTPETIKRAFEPFFSTKKKGDGTGLGLAMAYGSVKEHGGRVTVDSVAGAGTTMAMELPEASHLSESLPATTAHTRTRKGTGETVLIVDDEDLVLASNKRLALTSGYQVITAHGGPSGVAAFREHHAGIDVVLLDLTMPKLDGREVLRELMKIDATIPVIITSGYHHDTEPDDLIAAGAACFLPKPFTRDDLCRALATALGT